MKKKSQFESQFERTLTVEAIATCNAENEKDMKAMDRAEEAIKLMFDRYGSMFEFDVWSNIDRVYSTRIDCRTGRLEAA